MAAFIVFITYIYAANNFFVPDDEIDRIKREFIFSAFNLCYFIRLVLIFIKVPIRSQLLTHRDTFLFYFENL